MSHQPEMNIFTSLAIILGQNTNTSCRSKLTLEFDSNSMCCITYNFEVLVIICVQNTLNVMDIFINKLNFIGKRSYDFKVLKYKIFVQFIKSLKACTSRGALFDDTISSKALAFRADKKGPV